MITKGIVISTDGDKAVVRAFRQSACDGCDGCSEKGKCHSEIILSETPKSYELEVKNTSGVGTGDLVEIQSSGNLVLLFAVIVFILPVVFTMAAYMISDTFLDGNFPVLISAGVFLITFIGGAVISNTFIPKYSNNIISKIIKENSK